MNIQYLPPPRPQHTRTHITCMHDKTFCVVTRYAGDADDYSSFIASLTLALTMLCGFAIMADQGKTEQDFGDGDLLGALLVAISTVCMVLNFGIMMWNVDWPQYKRLPCARTKCCARKEQVGSVLKVAPADSLPEPRTAFGTVEERAAKSWTAAPGGGRRGARRPCRWCGCCWPAQRGHPK